MIGTLTSSTLQTYAQFLATRVLHDAADGCIMRRV